MARQRYAIRNDATGYLAFSGRTFRTHHRALRKAYKHLTWFGITRYSIVIIERTPTRPISLYDPKAVTSFHA